MTDNYKIVFALLLCIFLRIGLSAVPQAKKATKTGDLLIVVKKGQSIRDIADQYLSAPDRWPDILSANKLTSVTQIQAGMRLKIPYNEITRANSMLVRSSDAIREATGYKAKIFASADIDEAVRLRNRAIEEKKKSRWLECYRLADRSFSSAQKALDICRSQSDVRTMATLYDRKGDVEHRKPSALSWIDLPIHALLIEGEKVRTLYRSFADILFQEGSHLRLDQNSMAIIQRMRADLIRDKKESRVSLVKGNIYALLSGSSNKKFDVNLKGIKTDIRSKHFWIGKKEREVLLANYHGKIEVTARNATVVLEKNKGTKVRDAQKPTPPVDLLKAPEPVSPENNSIVFLNRKNRKINLSWKPVEDAAGYEVEVSIDNPSFDKIHLYRKDIKSPGLILGRVKNGTYYWRVWAVDKNGFPGVKSKPNAVNVINDTTAPIIIIHSPEQNHVIEKPILKIKGETEQNTSLTFILAGEKKKIEVAPTGGFEFSIPIDTGTDKTGRKDFTFTLEAEDRAQNKTALSRTVVYIPEKPLDIIPDASFNKIATGHFVVPDKGFTFRARTVPGTAIRVEERDGPFRARIIPEKDGRFSVSFFLEKSSGTFLFILTDPAGRGHSKEITFEVR